MFVLGSVFVKIALDTSNDPRPQMGLYERPVELHLTANVPSGTIPVQAEIDLKATSTEDLLHYTYNQLEKKPRAPPV